MPAKSKPSPPGKNDLPTKLSAPAQRALAGAGISQLDQLSNYTEKDISKLHGVGPNAIKQLKSALRARGLKFAPAKKS